MRKAAVWYAPEDVRIEELPEEPLGPHDCRLRIESVGICGSDVHFFYDGHASRSDVPPFVMGHEASGTVLEVGGEVTSLVPGDRVAIEPGQSCGNCQWCREGRYNLCPEMKFLADPPVDGSLTNELVVDARWCYKVPDELSFDAAALIEPTAVAVYGCRRAGVRPGDRVLISGAGPVGLLFLRVARIFGASWVTVTEVDPFRIEAARRLGADLVLDGREGNLADHDGVYDVLLEASGVPQVAHAGIEKLGRGGRALLTGLGLGRSVSIPVDAMQINEVTVTGGFRYTNAFPYAVELAPQLELDDLVTHTFPLEASEQALRTPREGRNCLKAVVHP